MGFVYGDYVNVKGVIIGDLLSIYTIHKIFINGVQLFFGYVGVARSLVSDDLENIITHHDVDTPICVRVVYVKGLAIRMCGEFVCIDGETEIDDDWDLEFFVIHDIVGFNVVVNEFMVSEFL